MFFYFHIGTNGIFHKCLGSDLWNIFHVIFQNEKNQQSLSKERAHDTFSFFTLRCQNYLRITVMLIYNVRLNIYSYSLFVFKIFKVIVLWLLQKSEVINYVLSSSYTQTLAWKFYDFFELNFTLVTKDWEIFKIFDWD